MYGDTRRIAEGPVVEVAEVGSAPALRDEDITLRAAARPAPLTLR